MQSSQSLACLIDFIDKLSIDESFYWRLPRRPGEADLELRWRRGDTPQRWHLRTDGDEDWVTYDSTDLLEKLAQQSLDTDTALKQIGASVMMQAVFARLVVQGAVRLFGADAVDQCSSDMERMLEGLRESLDPPAAKEPRLRLV